MPENVLSSFDQDRSNLIKAIQHVQHEEGYISDTQIKNLASHFQIPVVDVEGVVSFLHTIQTNKTRQIYHSCL